MSETLGGRRLLITGATGFIGRHVVAAAAARGAELHVMGRTAVSSAAKSWQVDLRDLAGVRKAIAQAQPDVIVHLAAGGVANGTGSLSELLLVNAAATAAIVEAGAALRTPPRVLLAGSGFEYQPQVRPHVESDPLDRGGAYALSKVTAGDAARSLASAISVTVLRLFGVYGPGERAPRLLPAVVEATQAGHPVELTAGDQIRDYTFVGDVAEAFMRLADTHLGIGVRMVNVGTGRPVSVRAFVEAAASALRRRGLSPDLRFGARESRQDERSVYVANVELLRQWLEWVPDTPLERGLEQSMEEMLAHPR